METFQSPSARAFRHSGRTGAREVLQPEEADDVACAMWLSTSWVHGMTAQEIDDVCAMLLSLSWGAGVTVFIDPMALMHIVGTVMDYEVSPSLSVP